MNPLRRRRTFFVLITFLTFDLGKSFPITYYDDAKIITSSSFSSTDSSMIENVTIVKSFESNFNATDDSMYEIYEDVSTMSTVSCDGEYEQMCENGMECILKEFMCDGRRDCSDNSDEEICQNQRVEDYPDSKGRFLPPTLKCPETWFFCKDASKCIEPAAACNGIDDCK
uniref:Uncharacterized protein n=1 Tax=Panagrolaimus superbus TaxID=310955 RepID=A0A914Z157_9BILA